MFTFTGGRWTGATASIEMRPITSDGDCTTTPVSTASFANTGPFVLHPANPAAPAPIGGAVQLALADLHSCPRLSSGAVQGWGYNGFGQLADGTHTDSSIAVTADGIPGTIGLAASVFHNCGVFAGGSEGGWSPFAVALTGAAPLATGVATGNAHSCMIVPGGGVRCQGADNSSGQLGDGTTTGAPHGTDVLGIGGATALAAGFDHSCALLGDRTVRCWGANASGQLGDGTTDDRPAPVEVTGVTGAVAVSAYGSSSCALIDDGTVRCWGDNSSGQLGNGTTISTSHPVVVLGVTGATALGEGGDLGCAVVAGGSVRCWGENSSG